MSNPTPPADHNDYSGPLAKYAPREEKTYSSVVDQVMDGNRYVTIPFVVSIVIMSFQRQMGGVHVVGNGSFPTGPLVGASLITVLFGWWGIPFGIIFSFVSCFHLFKGGRDVTFLVLENVVGPEEAKRILKIAPKPKLPASIWLIRAIVIAPFALIGFIILQAVNAS